jgi:hypothetical protein
MANSIALATKYVPLLDEIYKREALTSILEKPERVGDFVGANTVKYYKTSMDGLGAYARTTGYVQGDVTGTWETLELTQDRGRKFMVDAMDNEETINQAFGTLASEFIRTKVVPEIDAYRFAKIAGTSGIQTVAAAALDSSNVIAAIDAATTALDDKEVPSDGRVLYVTPQIYQAIKESASVTRFVAAGDNSVDRRFGLFDGMSIVKVPQARFYTGITLYDGSTAGQEAGGFVKGGSAANVNFLIVHPTSTLAVTKHAVPRIFDPSVNQDADAWMFQYRIYHDLFVYENKAEGIYLHKSTT